MMPSATVFLPPNYPVWDKKLKAVLVDFPNVEQPLLPFIDGDKLDELIFFLKDDSQYNSVFSLKYQPNLFTIPRHKQKSKAQQ